MLLRTSVILIGTCCFLSASHSSAAPPADTQGTTSFQNAPVNSILDLYETLSGKHFVRDANLAGLPPVTLNVTGLSKDETLKLISSYLLLNGVAIIPIDDHTLKVLTVGTNKQPRTEGVRLYTKPEDLPADDQIVTYYMPFANIDPQEAVGIFSQVTPAHTYGVYVPAPSAQAAILTENASIIRTLIDLQKLIDVRHTPNVPFVSTTPHSANAGATALALGLSDCHILLLAALNGASVFLGVFLATLFLRRRAA